MYTTFYYFPLFSLYFGSFVWRPLFKFRAESYKKSQMCRGILGDVIFVIGSSNRQCH